MAQKKYNTLSELKKFASLALASKKVPTHRDEEWRYSDLTLLIYPSLFKNSSSKISVTSGINLQIPVDHFYTIVFIDGKLDEQSSDIPKTGVSVHDSDSQEFLDSLSTLDLENGFDAKYQVLQNYSLMTHGALINITKALDKPLKIYYIHGSLHNFTTIINVASGVNIRLHEEFIQGDKVPSHLNQVTKIKLEEKAHCLHFKQSHKTLGAKLLYTSEVICEEGSKYDSYAVHCGYDSYRQDIVCYLNGHNASSNFYGVTIGKEKELYDIILKVRHNSSNTTSKQHYNQIFSDNSSGSFYSTVEIPESLHKIEAHQLNKNLLLGENAKAFSRPELDIHSDDVICSHGATVGAIDENAMEYLKSRGIDDKAAKELIIQGFLKAVFDDKHLNEDDYQNLISQITSALVIMRKSGGLTS